MELKLNKAKNLKGIVYKKEYIYGNFTINVLINPDKSCELEGINNGIKAITIRAIDTNPATLYIENFISQDENEIKNFIRDINDAFNLLKIMNEKRKELIKMEEE